jgi:hypothetical protein
MAPGTLVQFRSNGQLVTGKVVRRSYDSLLVLNKRRVWDSEENRYRLVGRAMWVVPVTNVIGRIRENDCHLYLSVQCFYFHIQGVQGDHCSGGLPSAGLYPL